MANKPQSKLNFVKGYGKNIKAIRTDKGLSLKEMGKLLNYSDKSISFIETETRPPTIDQLNAYMEKFNVSLDYLTGRTDTYRIDLQEICSYTGLDEKSIDRFHRLNNLENKYKKNNKSPIMDEFNSFIQSNSFSTYVYQIIAMKIQYKELLSLKKELSVSLEYDSSTIITAEQNFLKKVYEIGFDESNSFNIEKELHNKCKKYIELEKNYNYNMFIVQKTITDYIKIIEEKLNQET